MNPGIRRNPRACAEAKIEFGAGATLGYGRNPRACAEAKLHLHLRPAVVTVATRARAEMAKQKNPNRTNPHDKRQPAKSSQVVFSPFNACKGVLHSVKGIYNSNL